MKRCLLNTVLTLAASAPAGGAFAQTLTVNWDDPEVLEARANPGLFGSGSGFESSGPTIVSQAKLPVRALLISDLERAFSSNNIKLESSGGSSDVPVDFSAIRPDVLVIEDGLTYNIEYTLLPGLKLTIDGSRKVTGDATGAPGAVSEEVSIPESDDEVVVASIQQNFYGEILYRTELSCASVEVVSYCLTDRVVRAAADLQRLVFAGVRD